jgi:hypothetical protein
MIHAQIVMESAGTKHGARHNLDPWERASDRIGLMILFAAVMTTAFLLRPAKAEAKKRELPYVTIAHPQFISASQATFLSSQDILIGVTDGKTAKAYPAAILAQHGVVQDQMAEGPIAVTW